MARKIPGHKPGSLVEFIPEALGNKDEATPVRVFIRAPSEAERRAFLADKVEMVTTAGEMTPRAVYELALRTKERLVESFVASVENYADQDDKPVDTGKALKERGEFLLMCEVAGAIEEILALSEESKKNSVLSSDLFSPKTAPFDGTAASAEPPISLGSETAPGPMQTQSSATS